MLIKHDSEVAPVGASVNRTAIVDIPQGPNVDEPGAATAAGRPTPYFLTSPPRASRSTNFRAQKCTE